MVGPAPLSRRPQMSDEMRSVSFQSGPCSSSTTFLPARASTAANTEPAAPAPTITASTFSSAISPPLLRKDVGQVRHADPGEAFDGAIDDSTASLRRFA